MLTVTVQELEGRWVQIHIRTSHTDPYKGMSISGHLTWHYVPKPYGGEGDETEIEGIKERPVTETQLTNGHRRGVSKRSGSGRHQSSHRVKRKAPKLRKMMRKMTAPPTRYTLLPMSSSSSLETFYCFGDQLDLVWFDYRLYFV